VINATLMRMESLLTAYHVLMKITFYLLLMKLLSLYALIQESTIVLTKDGMMLNARNARLDSSMLELNVQIVIIRDVLNATLN